MNQKTKDRIFKFTFILNGLLFLFGGIEMLGEQRPLFGLIQLITGIFNLLMVIGFKKQKTNTVFINLIMVLNIVVSITIFNYYSSLGTSRVQYAYIVIAVLYTIALIVQMRKQKK